mgnify:CR=1 FL=1
MACISTPLPNLGNETCKNINREPLVSFSFDISENKVYKNGIHYGNITKREDGKIFIDIVGGNGQKAIFRANKK